MHKNCSEPETVGNFIMGVENSLRRPTIFVRGVRKKCSEPETVVKFIMGGAKSLRRPAKFVMGGCTALELSASSSHYNAWQDGIQERVSPAHKFYMRRAFSIYFALWALLTIASASKMHTTIL